VGRKRKVIKNKLSSLDASTLSPWVEFDWSHKTDDVFYHVCMKGELEPLALCKPGYSFACSFYSE
jgi:hypothetical protein